MTYLVMELQTNASGSVASIVTQYADKNAAESKYHTVLAAAAISSVPQHAACLLTNDGKLLDRQCYTHYSGGEG